ncbi:hypothetical protein CIG21_05650 [Corynebacterium hadale]|uniref:Integrase catalytic domain-containing protein n=1 Tax=Corynebacterium hadale TaxID=2026255 RepID=A0A269PEH5_9CORY|nr:hypothetical protein CIG21_05650 [Corynebacterium hadale]
MPKEPDCDWPQDDDPPCDQWLGLGRFREQGQHQRWVHWWNAKRLHETLDYDTPQEVEAEYYLTQTINTGP